MKGQKSRLRTLQPALSNKLCMYVCMYVWMDGWMDGWMDVRIYETSVLFSFKSAQITISVEHIRQTILGFL